MDVCSICLESSNNNDLDKPFECEHIFHLHCFKQLSKNHFKCCPICKQPVKKKYDDGNITYTFNNMLDNNERDFDIPYYISKWEDGQCAKNSHHFVLETLGDWVYIDNQLKLNYTCMYIKCTNCDRDIIVK